MSLEPQEYLSRLREAVAFLHDGLGEAPAAAIVLGSGLGAFVEELTAVRSLSYSGIPHFPVSGVAGQAGELVVARHGGKEICALSGRAHLYEGFSGPEVVFGVRAVGLWGVQTFIVSNTAGGINTEFQPGDLMLIRDHINCLKENPLQGPNLDELGERFSDMSEAYDRTLRLQAQRCAQEIGIILREGVYIAMPGPSYETPAEIRMCRVLGADAVGMSTVPEVIALNHLGKKVLGLSCITNMAAGIVPGKLSHREVLETARKTRKKFSALVLAIVEQLDF